MMTLPSHLLVLLLASSLAAQAVDSEAPDIVWTQTFEFGEIPAKKLSDLRGSVVLLEFWATHSAPCRDQIPTLNALHQKRVEEGLVVIGVTGEEANVVADYVKKHGVKHPIGIGNNAYYNVRGIPHAFLIDKDGKVLWRGHPASVDEAILTKALVGARPAIVLPGLEDAQAMRRAKDFGAAYGRAKQLIEGGKLSERAAAQAKFWLTEYEKFVADANASAAKALAEKDIYQEWAALQPVADYYQGVPGAEVAKQRFAVLMADPKAKKEIEAGKKFAAARAKEEAFDYDGAYAIFKEVQSLFNGTKVARDATALMKAYEKDGKLGYDHTCGYCKAGGMACPQHRKKKK